MWPFEGSHEEDVFIYLYLHEIVNKKLKIYALFDIDAYVYALFDIDAYI